MLTSYSLSKRFSVDDVRCVILLLPQRHFSANTLTYDIQKYYETTSPTTLQKAEDYWALGLEILRNDIAYNATGYGARWLGIRGDESALGKAVRGGRFSVAQYTLQQAILNARYKHSL